MSHIHTQTHNTSLYGRSRKIVPAQSHMRQSKIPIIIMRLMLDVRFAMLFFASAVSALPPVSSLVLFIVQVQ